MICKHGHLARSCEVCFEVAEARREAVALLRAWVAGCGDEHFSTKEQCRELLQRSGDFLATLNSLAAPPRS